MSAATLHTLRNGLETARDAATTADKTASLVSQLLKAGHTAKARDLAAEGARQTAQTAFLVETYLEELDTLEKETAQ
jgi:hypothetical protein